MFCFCLSALVARFGIHSEHEKFSRCETKASDCVCCKRWSGSLFSARMCAKCGFCFHQKKEEKNIDDDDDVVSESHYLFTWEHLNSLDSNYEWRSWRFTSNANRQTFVSFLFCVFRWFHFFVRFSIRKIGGAQCAQVALSLLLPLACFANAK